MVKRKELLRQRILEGKEKEGLETFFFSFDGFAKRWGSKWGREVRGQQAADAVPATRTRANLRGG